MLATPTLLSGYIKIKYSLCVYWYFLQMKVVCYHMHNKVNQQNKNTDANDKTCFDVVEMKTLKDFDR